MQYDPFSQPNSTQASYLSTFFIQQFESSTTSLAETNTREQSNRAARHASTPY